MCADAICMTLGNKKFCEDHGIRLGGRARKKEAAEIEGQSVEQRDLFKSDLRKRSVIEGEIAAGKRRYGLDWIMTKLVATSRSVIGMTFFVANTEKILCLLRLLFALLVSACMAMMGLSASGQRTVSLGHFRQFHGSTSLSIVQDEAWQGIVLGVPSELENEFQQALCGRRYR
ncbi:MAG: transposase [Cyanobium sp.]